jgi:hypothetical protein
MVDPTLEALQLIQTQMYEAVHNALVRKLSCYAYCLLMSKAKELPEKIQAPLSVQADKF